MSVTTLCSGSSLSTTHRNVPSHDLTVERCGADRRGAFWSLDTDLFPPPALCERRHRGLARRRVAVRRCAVFMVPDGERPHPGRAYRRGCGLEDATDDRAVGEHVVVVVVPLAGRARRPG